MSQSKTPRQEPDRNRTRVDYSSAGHQSAGFDAFREELRRALPQLRNPAYRPHEILLKVLSCDPPAGPGLVQSAIIASIAELEPDPTLPANSRARRDFDSLHQRFVLGLTQEETASALHLSVRHVQRVQAEATHLIARVLWDRYLVRGEMPDWRSQMEQELANLSSRDPDATADVASAIADVMELAHALASTHGIQLKAGFIQPGVVATVHPSALRQALVTAVGRMTQHVSPGELSIYAALAGGSVRITLTGPAKSNHLPAKDRLARDIITPPGATVEAQAKGDRLFLWLTLPSIGERTVLVIEDNLDMVHFYQRCTAGTPYRVTHLSECQDMLGAIEAAGPDIVVLDVMLPHVDGWQLLTHLYERLSTRSIPVIVCSVVKEEELALSLGAALFLAKPVQPRQFVQALDQVLQAPP